jgi:hypothetical protein
VSGPPGEQAKDLEAQILGVTFDRQSSNQAILGLFSKPKTHFSSKSDNLRCGQIRPETMRPTAGGLPTLNFWMILFAVSVRSIAPDSS